jgi:O-acetyl-ADP-ribose deacetylase
MIKVIRDDITTLDVDIIVNAANRSLAGGGGVDGAIHRKAGPGLDSECRGLHGCETGEAKMTNGYNLKAKKIIHTVGPIYHNGLFDEPKLLSSCYLNSLKLASEYLKENELTNVSIAFPCISTGIYGYPKEAACKIAVCTVKDFLKTNPQIDVFFVCFGANDYNLYVKEVEK